MKNIIIVLFSIILGIYLYGQVLGDDEGTLRNASQGVMEQQIEDYKNIP